MKWTPPRFTKGQQVKDPRQRLWNAMLAQKRFSVPELAYAAQTSEHAANLYLRALRRIDYVQQVSPPQKGVFLGHARWRLAHKTGSTAPVLCAQEGGVYDPNTRQQHPYPEPSPVEATAHEPATPAACLPVAPEEPASVRRLA